MELALEAVKSTNLVYYEQYQHHDITVEGASIDDLPLVPPTRGKKGFKEFFQYIAQISEEDLQAIQTAFMDGNLNLAALPASVRPRDALGDACRLQLIVEEQSNGEKRALKFFHSTVDIPLGLVRSLCENAPRVINYKIAPNSHLKMGRCCAPFVASNGSRKDFRTKQFVEVWVAFQVPSTSGIPQKKSFGMELPSSTPMPRCPIRRMSSTFGFFCRSVQLSRRSAGGQNMWYSRHAKTGSQGTRKLSPIGSSPF